MLTLQNITYIHPNKDLLFENISLTVNRQDKIAVIGSNGVGKSSLLKIMAGELAPADGQLKADAAPYYVPQIFGQYNELTIAETLGIAAKLRALGEILEGYVTKENMELLGDDWTIEERCNEALCQWQLTGLSLAQQMATLSGGQKTKVFLAGIAIHRPELVLLDEPTNHLDTVSRQHLYDFVYSTSRTLLIVSHDRTLLNYLDTTFELSKRGITVYGSNYDFYVEQKKLERTALSRDVTSKEKALRKAKEKVREILERQQKLDVRGRQKQEKAAPGAHIEVKKGRDTARPHSNPSDQWDYL